MYNFEHYKVIFFFGKNEMPAFNTKKVNITVHIRIRYDWDSAKSSGSAILVSRVRSIFYFDPYPTFHFNTDPHPRGLILYILSFMNNLLM